VSDQAATPFDVFDDIDASTIARLLSSQPPGPFLPLPPESSTPPRVLAPPVLPLRTLPSSALPPPQVVSGDNPAWVAPAHPRRKPAMTDASTSMRAKASPFFLASGTTSEPSPPLPLKVLPIPHSGLGPVIKADEA